MKTALKLLRELQAQADTIISSLPSPTVSKLLERWRSNTLEVVWDYLIVKTSPGPNGKVEKEHRWYPHTYGTLRGLGLWLAFEEQGYSRSLYELLRQLEGIPVKARLNNSEIEHAEAALNEVSALGVIERELDTQKKLIVTFLD